MNDDADSFDWGALGERWWLDAAETVGANRRQAMFAAAKHRGASDTQAAREAGYGDADTVRQAGHKAVRTRKVTDLLALAAAEAKGATDGTVDGSEARRILSKLARGSDPSIRIRAIEGLTKLDERQAAIGRAVDNDGFSEWRVVRDYLRMPGGGPAILHLYTATGAAVGNMPLLHDVRRAVVEVDPALWERARARGNAAARADLERNLADPQYQLDARRKLWREVGVSIDAAGVANGATLTVDEIVSDADTRTDTTAGSDAHTQAVDDDADFRSMNGGEAVEVAREGGFAA